MVSETKKKVLFWVGQETGLVPGQRFRFEQYIPFLEENGIGCEISPLMSKSDNRILYSPGNIFRKAKLLKKAIDKRRDDLRRIRAGEFAAVFVYRDAIMIRSTYFEQQVKKMGVPMVFDFDDSIWLQDVSDANRLLGWLKNPAKTAKIISLCHTTIAGNQYLQDYASPHNPNTLIIPTTIDTAHYVKKPRLNGSDNGVVTIGWSGSITTLKHFKTSIDVLKTLKQKYNNRICFRVIGDGGYTHQELGITGQWWKADTELEDLSTFDIGIMPLPDDLWSRGKCGLKGLQYMALEIPTVMSPVGVNSDIIQDGQNGFLASSHDQWVEKISMLVESSELREKLGSAGRQTVTDHYSVEANKQKWLSVFQNVIHGAS